MIPAEVRYERPATLEAALRLLGEGEAKAIAGGQSLLPLMRLRMAEPQLLVDLQDIPGLAEIRVSDDAAVIGALVRHAALARSAPWRVLREAAEATGDRQVRRLGTIGGAMAHADPAGDLPAALLALGAVVEIAGSGGRREVPIREFFLGPLTTSLDGSELLTGLRLPGVGMGSGSAYRKLRQSASGFALAGVAAMVRLAGGKCVDAGVGVTGVGLAPFAAEAAEARLKGTALGPQDIEAALGVLLDGVDVQGDAYASADYRAEMCRVLAEDAIRSAAAEAAG
jgi:carbon-monoxide dehydrogenase medium subunit